MSVDNASFEVAGATPGEADGWSVLSVADDVYAAFDATPEAVEDFEESWSSNESYKFAFTGPPTDLTRAEWQTTDPAPKVVEDFETFWNSNQSYVYGLSAAVASFDTGTPEDFEDFEEEWDANESYVFAVPDWALETVASFDAGVPQDFEDFEEEWDANESYLFEFVGVGTDLAAAAFEGPLDYEDFEGTWPTMTTI